MILPPFRPHHIRFCLRAFVDEADRPRSHRMLRAMLNTLTACNVYFLRDNPAFPGIYESGIRYDEEPIGQEDWCDAPTVLQQGWGDCEDLACWRSAEMIVQGERAAARSPNAPIIRSLPIFKWRRLNPHTTLYHILCMHEIDGQRVIEDPSRKLGMGTKPSQYARLDTVRQAALAAAAGWPPTWAA